jgi:hypothetical protein
MASRHGYRVYSVIVENRHQGQNTHGVPQNKLNMMENRFHVKLQ